MSAEDLKRYTEQQAIIVEIVEIYDRAEKDPSEEDGQRIVDLMQMVYFN